MCTLNCTVCLASCFRECDGFSKTAIDGRSRLLQLALQCIKTLVQATSKVATAARRSASCMLGRTTCSVASAIGSAGIPDPMYWQGISPDAVAGVPFCHSHCGRSHCGHCWQAANGKTMYFVRTDWTIRMLLNASWGSARARPMSGMSGKLKQGNATLV